MTDILGLLRLDGTAEVDREVVIEIVDCGPLRVAVLAEVAIVKSFARLRITTISHVRAETMRSAPEPSSSRNFPDPVRLQTAGEMIVLGVNRRTA